MVGGDQESTEGISHTQTIFPKDVAGKNEGPPLTGDRGGTEEIIMMLLL